MLVGDADADFAVVRVEDVALMSWTVNQTKAGFRYAFFERVVYVAMRVVGTVVTAANVFCGVLLPASERVAHIGFEAVGSPVSTDAVSAHVFGVRLCGGVVVECYPIKAICGSDFVYELESIFTSFS